MLANLSVSHSVLLRWVANEIVRVRIVDAARPLYSLDDVTRVMKEMALGRNQKPRTGRPRRAARAAK